MAKSNSERFYEGFQRFLTQSGHEQPTDDEMDALLQEYVKLMNEGSPLLASMAEEESADVFLDRAQEAKSRKERLKWIRKAREIEPDHVDAALAEIEIFRLMVQKRWRRIQRDGVRIVIGRIRWRSFS